MADHLHLAMAEVTDARRAIHEKAKGINPDEMLATAQGYIGRAQQQRDDLLAALEDERRWRKAVTAYLFDSLGEGTALERISNYLIAQDDPWSPEEWYDLHYRTSGQTDAAIAAATKEAEA